MTRDAGLTHWGNHLSSVVRPLSSLIEPGRVHRDVYTDPEIFELEMERIFGRAWLYIGHASQVKEPGDFITAELGRQPVIMVRHRDGAIHVLLNRCTHRGAKVVNERSGNAPRLTCCYHGWSFDTDGRLAAIPVPEGCAAGFDQGAFGLARAPRVAQYRGFVFASLAANGMSFEDHIGLMKRNIDDLVDRAPDGEHKGPLRLRLSWLRAPVLPRSIYPEQNHQDFRIQLIHHFHGRNQEKRCNSRPHELR
jgi:phenylpropionate dioxygenase-like ring-hydroxylating dioxygenase large terminal subunit